MSITKNCNHYLKTINYWLDSFTKNLDKSLIKRLESGCFRRMKPRCVAHLQLSTKCRWVVLDVFLTGDCHVTEKQICLSKTTKMFLPLPYLKSIQCQWSDPLIISSTSIKSTSPPCQAGITNIMYQDSVKTIPYRMNVP